MIITKKTVDYLIKTLKSINKSFGWMKPLIESLSVITHRMELIEWSNNDLHAYVTMNLNIKKVPKIKISKIENPML